MKICRIIYAYSPYSFGGADIRAEKISRVLTSGGNRTIIITINPYLKDTYEDDNSTGIYRFRPFNVSTIHNIGKGNFLKQALWTALDIYNPYSYNKIKSILKKEKPDVVHMHTPFDVTLSAVDAVKSLNLPLVYTLHDYFLLCRRVVLLHSSGQICTQKNISPLCKVYRGLTEKIIRDKIDIVIAPSQFILNEHRKYGFFKDTKAIVLSHGMEAADIVKNDNSVGKKQKGCLNILYTGSLTRHKGVHILIEAFRQIDDKNVRLHIVGSGVYENKLKNLAEGDARIAFYGRLSYEDTQKFYITADVSVVPSIWYDVRPNVIPEAFRASIPVIASDIGGIPEMVSDSHNGLLFKAGDIKQLKSILQQITKSPVMLERLSSNAKASSENFQMAAYVQKLLKIYEEAIKINKEKICAVS